MAVTVELREEERVSLRAAFVLFLFGILVLHLLYSIIFDIYRASVLTFQLVVPYVIAWRTFSLLISSFLHSQKKRKMLLYLVLGPLSFDKVCLIFDQGAQALINKASK